jgi:hypothetical protein
MQFRTSLKVLVSLLSLALVSCAQAPTSPDIVPVTRVATDQSCSSFVVTNLSTPTIGTINITGSGVQQAMAVGGTGSVDSATVCFLPDAVVIGNTTCTYPNTTTVVMATGKVSVSWTGNYAIAVIDLDEQS